MHQMYIRCRLVHADLSEYNLLWHPRTHQFYVIDVSQAVELEHPNAIQFLKQDIMNVTRFFGGGGEEGVRQFLVVAHIIGKSMAIHTALALLIHL